MYASQLQETLRFRAQVIQTIRTFFDGRDHIEVDTPVLSPDLIPEAHIAPFSTRLHHEFFGERDLYMVPSPEVFMKKLIADGSGSIYQISRCFRNEEQIGSLHNPEFTMLEWYTVNADYQDSIIIMKELLQALSPFDRRGYATQPVLQISVAEACWKYAQIDLERHQTLDSIIQTAVSLGLSVNRSENTTWDDVFNRIFLTYVEPELSADRPVILTEFPKQIQCLAKDIPGTPWKERWELYIMGFEIANCFSEETDGKHVASYYQNAYAQLEEVCRSHGRSVPYIDFSFPDMYLQNYPDCSGTALGVDRLMMSLLGLEDIRGVILFPHSDIL